MACQEFTVLYTHQKTKKSKIWQDGVLKTSTGGNKVKNSGLIQYDTILDPLCSSEVTENCRSELPKKTEAPILNRNHLKPTGLSLPHLPVGLKRKHTGFQGPRQVEKKMMPMEDDAAIISPTSKWSQSSFPSQLHITSPLFSTICKKDAETNLPSRSNNDACTSSDRDGMSVSSLVSTSYIGIPKEMIHNRNQSISISGQMESNCQTINGVAVSQNLRSKAEIIALLKSKPTQLCKEQKPSEITECFSGDQPSENTGILFKRKSETLSGHMDNSDRESAKNIQHQYTTEKTITHNHWDVYMLPNSAELSCDKEVTVRRHDKTSNLGLDLQDPYNPKASQFMTAFVQPVEKDRTDWATQLPTINESFGKDQPNTCVLSESNINKECNIQFVSSSEDVYSRSTNGSITFETNLPKSNENVVTESLKDSKVSSAQSQSEPLPRINSASVVNESRISGHVTWAGSGAISEELTVCEDVSDQAEQFMEINFNLLDAFDFSDTEDKVVCESNMFSQGSACLTKGAMAQNGERRVHRNCEVMLHSNEEGVVKYSTVLGERDDNEIRESLPLKLGDETCEGCDKSVKDALTPLIELGQSGAENIIEGMNASTLNTETPSSKKDLSFSPVCTVSDLIVNKKCSNDFVHSRVSNYECDTRNNKFEKTEIISYVPATLQTSVMDKNPEKDVVHLGGTNSQDSTLENYLGASGDDMKPISPLQALSLKACNSDDLCQYITGKYCTAFDKEHTRVSRTATYPLTKRHSTSKEAGIGETEFENGLSIMPSIHEAREGERMGTDCLKHLAQIDNSSGLPQLANDITLLRSLTEHKTALESLQMMEDNNGLLYQRETTKEKSEPAEELEERECLVPLQIPEPSCPMSYFQSW
uniref:5'-3' DNA helicase ZGRF1-like N-terminal domain-containing protein n=1 Tax=Chelonoidis abingdonii TaxID=106734 RepID=A0A8C0G9M9_CHEAB